MSTETMFSKKLPSNIELKKINLNSIEDPVRSKVEGKYDYVVICETYEDDPADRLVKEFCSSYFGPDNPKILILSIFNFRQKVDKVKGNLIDFYVKNSIDLKQYIHPHSYVLTIGRALYSIAYGNLSVDYFYDYVFNNTHFYSPNLQSYIFPIDSLDLWTEVDFNIDQPVKEEKKILRYILNWEYYFAVKQACFIQERPPFVRIKKPVIHVVTDIEKFYKDHEDDLKIAIDTETSGLNCFKSRVGCISISFDGIAGYYIDWESLDKEQFGKFISPKFQIYQNGKFDIKMMINNNMKREYLHIDCDTINLGHILNEMRDGNALKGLTWIYTSYGGYDKLLNDYVKKHKISNYLNIPASYMESYSVMDAIVTFNCYVEMEKQLDKVDKKVLIHYKDDWNLRRYFYEIVIPTLNNFIDIENEGTYINIQAILDERVIMLKEFQDLIIELWDNKIFRMSEYKQFNKVRLYQNETGSNEDKILNKDTYKKFIKFLASSKQLGDFLRYKKYRPILIGKNGSYRTGDPELTEWLNDGHSEFELIVSFRKVKKLLDNYVGYDNESGIFKHLIKHKDGSYRVHSDFGVMLAVTHRFKCYDPNLQQVPKHVAHSKRIRKFFSVPNEDYYIVEYDAAGFQLRIGAILSGDEEMYKVFTELGGDMHSMTAVSVLKRDITLEEFMSRKDEEDLKLLRYKSKAINFGFEFGSSAFAFAMNILRREWDKQEILVYIQKNNLEYKRNLLSNVLIDGKKVEAEFINYWAVATDIRNNFFNKYAGLKAWVHDTPELAEKQGYVRSSFGAIRRLPQLLNYGKEGKTRRRKPYKNLLNQSLNSPVQNYEIVLVAKTLNGIVSYIKENNLCSRVFATVHDSIVMYVHKNEVERITIKAKEIFEEDISENCNIPMELEGDVSDYNKGEVWGEGTDILQFIEESKSTNKV